MEENVRYKVLIVDDYAMPRQLIESYLRRSDRYRLAGSLGSAEAAVAFCRGNPVDLVVLDVVMGAGMNGLEAARQIKAISPGTRLILMTSMPEESYLRRAREIGVESFWYKEIQERPLLEIIDRTMAGESVYPDTVPAVAVGDAVSGDFTPAELLVLRELTTGATNREIGARLFIEESTVKQHIRSMLGKTGCRNRLELAIKARVSGLVIGEL